MSKGLLRMSVKEYCDSFGCDYEDVCDQPGGKYIHVRQDDCPLVGVEYTSGRCVVLGLGQDRNVSFSKMLDILWEF